MWRDLLGGLALAWAAAGMDGACAEPVARIGIGREITHAELAAWDIDVRADGQGLPPGRGSVAEGARLYAERCATCHGAHGEGAAPGTFGPGQRAPFEPLVGGRGSLAGPRPVKTVGSFWPYAPTLFDFINRAMPFDAPQSLTAAEVYAVSAYVLHLNGLLPADAVLDAASLPKVEMPNREGFIADPRPDVRPFALHGGSSSP